MNNNKELKMNYKKETKRCMMPKNYNDFKLMISKCYGIPERDINNLLISYTDDEEDKVLIASEFDFEQAIIFMEKQKINILRINIDFPEKSENFEMIEKTLPQSNHNSLDKSFKSNSNVIVEEVKELPKDLNNKTISTIARDTERNVNKMSEICNKIENMTILDKMETVSTTDKNQTQMNNFDDIFNKFRNNQIPPLVVKPIVRKEKKNKKVKDKKEKFEKKNEIKPIFSYSNDKSKDKKEKSKDDTSFMGKFSQKLKESVEAMLEEKLARMKEKIASKTVKKSMKMLEKFMSKKKNASQDLEKELPVKSSVVHTYVTCDGCGVSPIQGHRFKCAVCHDFDYCASCEERNKDNHPHPFILIRTPERAPHSISCVVKESCPVIQKSIPFNQDYKLADVMINNSINNSIIVEVNELSSQCLTNTDVKVTEGTNEVIKTLKLKNNGVKSWPKPVYLTCLNELSTMTGNSVPIKLKVESGKENNVEVKLNSKDFKEGSYVSVWQLQNEKKEFFGTKFFLFITIEKVNSEKPLEVKNSFIQKPKDVFVNPIVPASNNNMEVNNNLPREEIYDSFVFQCQVDELKSVYNLRNFDDKTIKQAAVEAKGDVDMTLQILMNKAQKK